MSIKVFIDGQEGTTGLKILERFNGRNDIELLRIDEEKRKDSTERAKLINESDFTFLCLPDAAAIEAVSLCTNPHTRIIDASTAHRCNPDWAYGFPELSAQYRASIIRSKRVAVPGCYASGFVSIVKPLIDNGIMAPYHSVTCFALSGYSGAGKKGIAQYEDKNRSKEFDSPRMYALALEHKHLKEMQYHTRLSFTPIFNPIIDNYYRGMLVNVPLISRTLAKTASAKRVHDILAENYAGSKFVKVMPLELEEAVPTGFLAANSLAGTNMMEIYVFGNNDRFTITSRLDNLGKGASGAAVQCMNIMMGVDEGTGLE